jgi:hypothetical protein
MDDDWVGNSGVFTMKFRNRGADTIAAAVCALVLAGCAGNNSNCGSATAAVAAATLKRTDLSFAESGLVGGHIVLQGGKRCAIVLDVERYMPSENLGEQFRLIASTSRHCDILEQTKPSGVSEKVTVDTVSMKIYANNTFHDIAGTSLNPKSSSLDQGNAFASLDAAYDKDVNPFRQSEAQKCIGEKFKGTFCTTIGDMISFRLLIGKAWGGEISPKLLDVLKEAFKKREQIRSAAKLTGGPSAEASKLSAALLERWELRQEFRHRGAYLPDVALMCLKPELLKQVNPSNWSTLPNALDQPAGREVAEMGEWRKAILTAWRGLSPNAITEFCKANGKEDLLSTYQDALAKAGLIQGGVVKSDVRLFAYGAALLRKQNDVNAQLQDIWSRLSSTLLSGSGRSNIWAATNVVMSGDQSEKFVTFSMGSDLFKDAAADVLPSGYIYRKNNTAVASPFINGESGSLFTYRGQFPLLALYSVDGKESSGGVAAIPLPTRSSTAASQPSSGSNPPAAASDGGSSPAGVPGADASNTENSPRSTGEAWRGTSVPYSDGSADAGDAPAATCL